MKTILISSEKQICYDESSVEINRKKVDDLGERSPEEYAFEQLRAYYKSVLSNHFENLVILTGAGSSMNMGTSQKGKSMKELWECVIEKIGEAEFNDFCEKINFEKSSEDLESMLSQANIAEKFKKTDKTIKEMIKKIQDIIKCACTLELQDCSPQEILLNKTTSRKLKYPRLKLFTLNYDTLFEQAAMKNGYIVIDGFSFEYPRRFNGKYFDYDIVIRENSRIKNEENYAPRVFHLYKPHGSIDWEKEKNEAEDIKKSENPENPLMIYPKNTKYESSYQQPFFEMMSRFQQAMRQPNTFLIVIGFSFYDNHIKSMVEEALHINQSFRLMVVNPDIEGAPFFKKLASEAIHKNTVFLVGEKFEDFVEYYPCAEIYNNSIIQREGIESDTTV